MMSVAMTVVCPLFAVTVVADRGRGANLLPRGREAGCETVGADGIGARGWRAGHGCGSWGGLVWVGKTAGLSVLVCAVYRGQERNSSTSLPVFPVFGMGTGWWRWMYRGGQAEWDGAFFGGVGMDWEVIELTELR